MLLPFSIEMLGAGGHANSVGNLIIQLRRSVCNRSIEVEFILRFNDTVASTFIEIAEV